MMISYHKWLIRFSMNEKKVRKFDEKGICGGEMEGVGGGRTKGFSASGFQIAISIALHICCSFQHKLSNGR